MNATMGAKSQVTAKPQVPETQHWLENAPGIDSALEKCAATTPHGISPSGTTGNDASK